MDTNEGTERDPFNTNIQARSTTDCTGLIPSLPQDDAERESYEGLCSYITETQRVNEDAEG